MSQVRARHLSELTGGKSTISWDFRDRRGERLWMYFSSKEHFPREVAEMIQPDFGHWKFGAAFWSFTRSPSMLPESTRELLFLGCGILDDLLGTTERYSKLQILGIFIERL
jgi:hypothetical protein